MHYQYPQFVHVNFPARLSHRVLRVSLATVALLVAGVFAASADTDNLPPGYSIKVISSNVSVSEITQMAFRPGDLTHVYAVRSQQSKVSRYDYDPVTGQLSNATDAAVNPDNRGIIGLGFHGTNLYTSLAYGSSDDRLSRWFDSNDDGLFESRHDFVYNIPTGNHNANQIQILGDSLYVGIGAAGRKGDPSEENLYTMTVARVADLTQVITTGVGSNYKGPVNYLASPTEWTNTAPTDGLLRYFASGFRNPFGIAFDPEGALWVTVNGNSDAGFLSDDFIYKNVQAGDEGEFPPPEFGYSKHIYGNPITNFINLGLSPSPGGLDFILDGPDAGLAIVGELGATRNNSLGRDLLLVDTDTGSYEQIYQFSTDSRDYGVSDVVRDPFGRFLVSDYGHNAVWLLTPPLPEPELSVTISGLHVELRWPLTGVEYTLQESSTPENPDSWMPSTVVPDITTNGILASVTTTNDSRFYRLKKD